MQLILLLAVTVAAVGATPAALHRLPFLPDYFNHNSSIFDHDSAVGRFSKIVGNLDKLVRHKNLQRTLSRAKGRFLKRPSIGDNLIAEVANRLKGTVLDRPSVAEINEPIAQFLSGGDVMPSIEDLKSTENTDSQRVKRGAPVVTSRRWSKTQPIGFTFNTDIVESTRRLIRSATQKIAANTCLTFRENANVGTQLQFHQGGGCWSYIGQQPVAIQPISIDSGCEIIPIISHEISHALGLDHTQNRKDRDAYLSVNLGAVDSGIQHNFAKLTDAANNNFGVPYDYGSDMHYGALDFSNNGQPVLIASQGDYTNTMGQRRYLTFNDYKMINRLYDCNANCPASSTVCQNGGYSSPRQCNVCVCNDFFTGTTCETPKAVVSISDSTPFTHSFHQDYNEPVYISGNQYNWDMFGKDPVKIIRAPAGRRIRVTIARLLPAFGQLPCYLGCPFSGLEFVDDASGELSNVGKIYCCTKDENASFVSKSNVIGYKAYASPGLPFDGTVVFSVI